MKSKIKQEILRFPINLLYYGNPYFIERIAALEMALVGQPTELQIDLLGDGEITAGWALLIRSILRGKSPDTWITTNARSSLRGATVLVWLQGDQRLIRKDAHVFFRRADTTVTGEEDKDKSWEDGEVSCDNAPAEADSEEAEYARVLHLINEFLPVKELAGRLVDVRMLRQFGLVENEKLDRFLADVFSGPQLAGPKISPEPKTERECTKDEATNQDAPKK